MSSFSTRLIHPHHVNCIQQMYTCIIKDYYCNYNIFNNILEMRVSQALSFYFSCINK